MAGRVRERSLGEGARELSSLPPPPDPYPQPLMGDWEGSLRGGRGNDNLPAHPSTLGHFLSLKPGRAALLWGESVRSLAAAVSAWAAVRRIRVLAVDAANAFDPYRLVRETMRRGLPSREALNRVRVARAFTCHQLVRLVQEELTGELAPGSLVLMLGPVSLFYDEQIPLAERRRLFQNLVQTLTAIKTRHPLLLLQPCLPKKVANRRFGRMLGPVVDVVGSFGGGQGLGAVREPPLHALPTPHR